MAALDQRHRMAACRRVLAGSTAAIVELAGIYQDAGLNRLADILLASCLTQAQVHARAVLGAEDYFRPDRSKSGKGGRGRMAR